MLDGCRSNEPRGLRESAFRNVLSQKALGHNSQLIFVLSMAEKRRAEDDKVNRIRSFEVGPWTLEQQLEACRHPNFLEFVQAVLPRSSTASAAAAADAGAGAGADAAGSRIQRVLSPEIEELIIEKHYYAGCNARWMFANTMEEMLADILYYLESVSDKQALLNGYVGTSSPQASNHLMVRFKSGDRFKVFPASKYIASQVLSSCNAAVYRIAYDLATSHANPAFLGWVVEFDFIAQLKERKGRKFDFVSKEGKISSISWDVKDVIDFDPRSALNDSTMPPGTWLKPGKWNQEGYDLTGLFCDSVSGKRYLRFVQITNAVDHTTNLAHFKLLIDRVKLELKFL